MTARFKYCEQDMYIRVVRRSSESGKITKSLVDTQVFPVLIDQDFQFKEEMLLRTVPTNTEVHVFLRGLWLCGKSRS